MTVGERIKQRRIELNLSQDELARKVGYKSRSSIQKIECARNLPLPKVEKMAVALGCTPSYLMGWEDTESERAAYEEMLNAYINRERTMEFLNLYEKASPEIQEMVLLVLKSSQPKS